MNSNYRDSIKEKYLSYFKDNIPEDFLNKIISSLRIIESFHEEVNYLSFNGGKDCLAVFLLFKIFNALNQTNPTDLTLQNITSYFKKAKESNNNRNIKFLYFVNSLHFREEEDYIFEIINREKVETIYLNSEFIPGLYFLESRFPNINNIYMGIRLIDLPQNKRNIGFIEKSTSPYPVFNRIYPIINWSYEDVWRLILVLDYPYLNLYDKGFTSIGKVTDTETNKTLLISENVYLPAYCLNNFDTEREYRYK